MQQLDILADFGTKSYIVGSTNSLLLQQRDRYSDILINLDEMSINITSASLRSALALSSADRRWIDFITQSVNDTWDESNPGRPKTMGYVGSEEFIRLQFEEYLLSLISAVKCHNYMARQGKNPRVMLPQVEGDPSSDFGIEWIEAWSHTDNYRIFQSITDSHLFDIVEPRHPCAGGLTIDDVQRRLAQQVQDLHLDERFAVGKEKASTILANGKDKASLMFNKFYADMEALREAQRRKHEEQKAAAERNGTTPPTTPVLLSGQPDLKNAQATVASVGSKAGAYFGSWASWAGEKRKNGWASKNAKVKPEKDIPVRGMEEQNAKPPTDDDRPKTQESYGESIFDADHLKDVDEGEESDADVKRILKEEALAKLQEELHEAQSEGAHTNVAKDGFDEIKLDDESAEVKTIKEGFEEVALDPVETTKINIEADELRQLEEAHAMSEEEKHTTDTAPQEKEVESTGS